MPYVVLCGPAKSAPDLVVGPFGTAGQAEEWIADQAGEAARYAVPMALTVPQGHDRRGHAHTPGTASRATVGPPQADRADAHAGIADLSVSRGHGSDILVTECPPTPFHFAQGTVHIATQRWELEQWKGAPDPPDLKRPWGTKPKFSVNGRRSCAELGVVEHLRRDGWDGVWVSAFDNSLRTEWFPAPAFRTLADAGAPVWAAETFERLVAANDGKLSGFFDVFAWREPDEVSFMEVKVARDRIQPTQRKFVERALRLHDQSQFVIIEVPG